MIRIRHSRAGLAVLSIAALVLAGCSGDADVAKREPSSTPTSTPRASTTTPDTGDEGSSKETVATEDPAWSANASALRGQNGTSHQQTCPPNPSENGGSVWGAGTYTDDSSICTAAVQSGLIAFAEGGTVTFEIADGLDAYRGGVANGVTSSGYGAWSGSFTFPDAPPGSVDFGADAESWSRTAGSEQGPDGTRVTVECSPGGALGSIWGSGPYTADSSICTAGVHSGVIDETRGGPVTIELAAGRESYEGSTANGITSTEYGSYGRSFLVVQP